MVMADGYEPAIRKVNVTNSNHASAQIVNIDLASITPLYGIDEVLCILFNHSKKSLGH